MYAHQQKQISLHRKKRGKVLFQKVCCHAVGIYSAIYYFFIFAARGFCKETHLRGSDMRVCVVQFSNTVFCVLIPLRAEFSATTRRPSPACVCHFPLVRFPLSLWIRNLFVV